MSALESLYQELILEHAKKRHGFGLVDSATESFESHQYNPMCGDEIQLRLELSEDRKQISAITWEGKGCTISQASASLLAELAPGLSTQELTERIELFRTALRSKGTIEIDEEIFGDAVALSGVSKFMARVKCAMLAWVAAEDALLKSNQVD